VPRLHRQSDGGAEAAQGGLSELDVAAVAADHVAGDGQAKVDAAGFGVARDVETVEGAKGGLARALGAGKGTLPLTCGTWRKG